MRNFNSIAHFLLVVLLACSTTKSSFNNSFKNYRIVVYESKVTFNQPEFLLRIRDGKTPLTKVTTKDFFVYEDNDYPSLKTEIVNLSAPATLHLSLLIDLNAENTAYLSLAKWVICKALQQFSLPLKVRLFSYTDTAQEITSGYTDKIDQVLDLLEQLETTAQPGGNEAVLKKFLQEFNVENQQFVNLSLSKEEELSNSALLIASKADKLATIENLYHHSNIILLSYENQEELNLERQSLDPYNSLFVSYPLNEETLIPLTQGVLAKQLEELVGGYYKLNYLSRFREGVHDASFAFESHPESGTKVSFNFSKHMYYHFDPEGNLRQMAKSEDRSAIRTTPNSQETAATLPSSTNVTEPEEKNLPEKGSYQELVVTSLGDNWKAESFIEEKTEDESSWWYVQVGAFKREEGCYNFLDPLTKTYQTSILKATIEEQSLYRCLIGPVEEDNMATLKELLTFQGYKGVFGIHSNQLAR